MGTSCGIEHAEFNVVNQQTEHRMANWDGGKVLMSLSTCTGLEAWASGHDKREPERNTDKTRSKRGENWFKVIFDPFSLILFWIGLLESESIEVWKDYDFTSFESTRLDSNWLDLTRLVSTV